MIDLPLRLFFVSFFSFFFAFCLRFSSYRPDDNCINQDKNLELFRLDGTHLTLSRYIILYDVLLFYFCHE